MRLFNWIITLLYPRKCTFCSKVIDKHLLLCPQCEKKLPFIPSEIQPRKKDCVDEIHSVFYYRDAVRSSIHRYKFEFVSAYSEIYGHFLRKYIDENHISCDIISWIPLSRKRLRERGYDQAQLLAKECGAYFGKESQRVLRKIRDTKAQSGILDAKARKTNVKDAYIVESKTDVRGKVILLVDDVVTTASTAMECARMLKQAGAARIIVLSLAAVIQ